jgi:hypothetical protein
MKAHNESLSELVKELDNSFPEDVKWTQENRFHFRG